MFFKAVFCPAFFLILFLSIRTDAAVLPELYPPQVDFRRGPKVDENLKKWFSKHVDQLPVSRRSSDSLMSLRNSADRLTRLLIDLQRASSRIRDPLMTEIREAINQELMVAKKEGRTVHPLTPYLLSAFASQPTVPKEEVSFLESALTDVAPRSCPGRKLFVKSIAKDSLDAMSDKDLIGSFSRIREFRASSFRRFAYDLFFSNLSASRRNLLIGIVDKSLGDTESMLSRHTWVSNLIGKSNGGSFIRPMVKVRESAKARQCIEAERQLMTAIESEDSFFKKDVSLDVLDSIIDGANTTSRCFRRKGIAQSISFWDRIQPKLTKVFGFPGKAAVYQRKTSVLWNADQMEQAIAVAQQWLSDAKVAKSPTEINRSEFMLARILEDNKNRNEAKTLYGDVVRRGNVNENFETALVAFVLMQFEDGEYEETLKVLNQVLADQDSGSIEQKSSSLMSFTLFWQGRIFAITGREANAKSAWRRLANEFYSTYYGVLGHILYERKHGKRIVLEPSRTPPFSDDFLSAPFDPEDRMTMERVAGLLRLGMGEDAICELKDVVPDDNNLDQVAARALALFAGKEWLEAIKLMDSLPRAYRNSLPAGFERIFFPREHENLVHDYTRRVKLDPDFVFGLIRQESVFNPKAQSPVGASGLMQLMPATARLEAQRLTSGYVSSSKKLQIRRAVSKRSNLMDPEINVALGVHHIYRLFQKYKNPVLMLSAYNASPTAADRWSREISFSDPLIAVERIPYRETRNYVKLIMRNYFYYKRWYVGARKKMPYIDYLLSKVEKSNRNTSK